jgi:hypothetical protein
MFDFIVRFLTYPLSPSSILSLWFYTDLGKHRNLGCVLICSSLHVGMTEPMVGHFIVDTMTKKDNIKKVKKKLSKSYK